MDKPEWAFTYIVKLSTDYGVLLDEWVTNARGQSGKLDPVAEMAVSGLVAWDVKLQFYIAT